MNKYDVIIIGAGAAGLSAALYATRQEHKTLVISLNLGGQAAMASEIENYPGVLKETGLGLMKKFAEQAKKFGAEINFEKAEKIEKNDNTFKITTNKDKYQSKTLILALGKTPRRLNVPGEGKFSGKGIAYCATCDAPLFRDKNVAVVGGGNSALDAVMLLSKIAKKVYLIHRRDQFRGEEYRVTIIKKTKKVELVLNSEIKEIKGDDFINKIVIENNQTNKKNELKIEGLFVEIGYEVDPALIKDFVKLDENNQIVIKSYGETSMQGVFAAGDVTNVPYKQIIISAGSGAEAALSAYNYIHKVITR